MASRMLVFPLPLGPTIPTLVLAASILAARTFRKFSSEIQSSTL